MNNNDLAALAALGAMGYMYNEHMKGKGAGPAADAAKERFAPYADVGIADAKRDIRMGGFDNTPAAVGVGTAGPDKRSDMDDFATGNGGIRARDVVYGGGTGKGGRRGGNGAGTPIVSFTGNGSGYDRPFLSGAAAPDVVPEVAPEESSGMGGAGLAAAGAGAAGAGAAAYYARVKEKARLANKALEANEARLAKEARAAFEGRPITGELSETQKMFAAGPDRAARAQAQAEAEANSRATQERVDSELRKNRTVRNDINERAAVLNKDMWAAGPTVTSETPTKKRAPIKAEAPTDMDDFNRMLRESKVGRANTSGPTATASRASADTQTREDAKAARARARLESSGTALPVPTTTTTAAAPPRENAARMTAAQKAAAKQAADMEAFNKQLRESKVGLPEAKAGPAETTTSGKAPRSMRGAATPAALAAMAVLAAAPDIASAGVQTYKGDTSGAVQSLKDSKEALKALAMLPVDVSRAAMKGDFGPLKDLAMSMNPATLLFNETSKHDDEIIKRMIEKEKAAASKKAAGGQIKAKKMASGGMTSTVSSASKRGDGIASKGKTRCKMY